MIEISENASRHIRKIVTKQAMPATAGLRVGVKAGGCSGLSYVFAWDNEPKSTDQVLEAEGARVFVDPRSLKFLEGTRLDFDTGLLSKGFFFCNPKAKSTCGCGTSFSV